MAGVAAHLLVWRRGLRGGRAGSGRLAVGFRQRRRSSLGRGCTEPDSGWRRRRLGACSKLPRDSAPRRQTDRPQGPRPPPTPPALLANCLLLSLPLSGLLFPLVFSGRKKKKIKLQNQRRLEREGAGGGGVVGGGWEEKKKKTPNFAFAHAW